MNVTQLETDDVVTQLETFVMMVPNIAMRGAVSMAGEGFALESPTGPLGPICPPQGVGPGKGLSFCLMKLGPSPDRCHVHRAAGRGLTAVIALTASSR